MDFKGFLLCEEKQYFGARLGDLLNGIHDLNDDAPNMGERHVVRLAEALVNQIRQVLRGRWSIRQRPHLERLQKVGVAIMRAVDEKGDLAEVLRACGHELQQVAERLGTPVNQVGSGLAGG